ncbi:pentapeptide repeat-containing protein [Candidatus Dojkabacteria bacterium]|nr:pentapeptide repeat-containing protein [Candidatus Dojkabacteria bacterium]
MEKKLQQFLDSAFAPYGSFPARADVTKELLANLLEKYKDLKKEGKSDEEAYQSAVDSFGDVEEIMEQVPHTEKSDKPKPVEETGLRGVLKNTVKQAKVLMGFSRFASTVLNDADLSDSDLSDEDFSYSSLIGTVFNGSNLTNSTFRASAVGGASFVKADLSKARFAASDLTNVNFSEANLTGAKFNASALHDATFQNTIFNVTEFINSDLDGMSFDNEEFEGVTFSHSSFNKTTFKNSVLRNVFFRHCDVEEAIFDGTKMDKVTYALLKGAGAVLDKAVKI